MWKHEGVTPDCTFGKTPERCDLWDCAPDIELNRFVNAYISAKHLGQIGNRAAEERILDSLMLYEDTSLLLQMEVIWNRFIGFQKQKQEMMKHGR